MSKSRVWGRVGTMKWSENSRDMVIDVNIEQVSYRIPINSRYKVTHELPNLQIVSYIRKKMNPGRGLFTMQKFG